MDQQQPPQPEPAQQDFDIWEFVTCAKCQLSFSPDGVSGPSVPFWITECGHVLCNTHLNADQSCPSCNAQGIELMPLQKEMPPPFSDWFCSLPFKLDALAQAAKFQHERTAGAARYYKSRYEQYRAMFARVKAEIAQIKALRKENEALKSENARLRGGWTGQQQQGHQQNPQYQQEPASYVNTNGKRRLVDSGLSTSSPRSIHTPIGPPRITLPPDHDPPPSLSRLGAPDGSGGGNMPRQQPSGSRMMQPPGSSHFSQQYAYNPPYTPQMQVPTQQVLSYEQQAPIRQQQQNSEHRLMPPPPTPQNRQLGPVPNGRQMQRVMTPRIPEHAQFNQNHSRMQIPQSSGQGRQQQSYSQSSGGGQFQSQSLGQAPRRFVPPATSGSNPPAGPSNPQRFVPPTSNGAQRHFVPQTPTRGEGRRFVPTGSSGPMTAQRSTFAPAR